MYIVIMAGGSGTRFWPVSRASRPKQFLPIVGDKPMIVATYERVKPLASDGKILLVIGREHQAETEELFAGSGVHILAEPQGRNTAPCIGLASKFVEHLGGEEPIVILPADHYIANPGVFLDGLRKAADIAARAGIVTLGIVPTRPETGYGYIEQDSSDLPAEYVRRVSKFVEKPDLDTARNYLLSGNFYWNAGIFVARPETLLQEFSTHMPIFHEGLEQLALTFDTPRFPDALQALYESTVGISFDYAIMEKTSTPVYVIPCDCGWSDVGSWYSLYEVRKENEQDVQGNVKEGEAWMSDCRDSFVVSRGRRLLAVLGLEGVLVVDTEDALLVADLARSQDIKKIIAHLERRKLRNLL